MVHFVLGFKQLLMWIQVSLRYNPTLQLGSFMIRISDFNWVGGADPFSLEEVKPVVGGVRQD